jgi:hypothetical protein
VTDHDSVQFAEAMGVLCETFGEPLSDLRTEGYFDALRDFPIEAVSAAFRQALRVCRFFPKPIELRELVAGRPEDAAEQAWAAVLREIRRVGYVGKPQLDARTLRAVSELWGGWQRLCETLPAEGPELVGWIKQFKAAYQSAARETQRELTMATINPKVLEFITAEQKRLGAAS